MSAVIVPFRPFQSAVMFGARAGIDRREAVHQVAEAIREGATGQHIAGQFQHAAMRSRRPEFPTPPEAA